MSRLLRLYAIGSLVAILLALALLTAIYRQTSVRGTIELAGQSNLALAQSALNTVSAELLDYLAAVSEHGPQGHRAGILPPEIARAVRDLMENTSVIRIKLYNSRGVVVFSTLSAQIGRDESDNPGFAAAIGGRIDDRLVYRDIFNAFGRAADDDNLLQTYIPIRASPADPVGGVFEIYADVAPLVHRNERALIVLIAGAVLILGFLYIGLILLLRQAGELIESQRQTIRERTLTLELLSSQMLRNEESQKKKIAVELNEGLAQTLSAIKVTVEDSRQRLAAHKRLDSGALEAIVPALQRAIQEVRTIATELRPPSLDDLGLLATIRWYGRQIHELHPGLAMEAELSLQESDIPVPLKIVVYRVMESVLKVIARDSGEHRIRVWLRTQDKAVALTIEEFPTAPAAEREGDPASRFVEAAERVSLSGGEFSAEHNSAGGVTLRAAWEV